MFNLFTKISVLALLISTLFNNGSADSITCYSANSAISVSTTVSCDLSVYKGCSILYSTYGYYSAGCALAIGTNSTSLVYCTTSLCNTASLVTQATGYVTKCNYASYDYSSSISSTTCGSGYECCYIQKSSWSSNKYYAGCSYFCWAPSSTTAYCNSNSCNTVSLVGSSADSVSISKRFATLAVLFAVVNLYFK